MEATATIGDIGIHGGALWGYRSACRRKNDTHFEAGFTIRGQSCYEGSDVVGFLVIRSFMLISGFSFSLLVLSGSQVRGSFRSKH